MNVLRRALSPLIVFMMVLPALQVVQAASNPVLDQAQEGASEAVAAANDLVPWGELPWHSQQEILDAVKGEVDSVDGAVAGQLSNLTGVPMESLLDLVPLLHDALVAQGEALKEDLLQAINDAIALVPVPVVEEGPPPSSSMQFMTTCMIGSTGVPTPREGNLCFPLVLVTLTIAQFYNEHKLFCLDLDEDVLHQCSEFWEFWRRALNELNEANNETSEAAGEVIQWLDDLDGDGLNNIGEFRWEHIPLCIPTPLPSIPTIFMNCMDFEKNQTTGAGGDEWWDGPEVHYWNNPYNDPLLGLELNTSALLEEGNRTYEDANRTANQTAHEANRTTEEAYRTANETVGDDEEGEEPVQVEESSSGGAFAPPKNPPKENNECTSNCGGCTSNCNPGGGGCTSNCNPGGGGGGCTSNCYPGGGGGCTTDCPLPDPNNPPDPKMLLYDPDRLLDTDGDGLPNVRDTDSDNDGLLDGLEHRLYRTYPEFADSDCNPLATNCTRSTDTTYYDVERQGNPGTGDGMNDSFEIQIWNTILGENGWAIDCDDDGITNILDADSDNDGVRDGDEIAAGTNPCSGYDGPTNTVAKMDPTNQNLPFELMDPTNLQYLQEGRSDAEALANETVAVVDQLISAAIAGNVTQALNVLYNYTPVAAPLRAATQMVQMSQDAVLDIVKCGSSIPATQGVLEPATLIPGDAETAIRRYADNVYDPSPLLPLAGQILEAGNNTAEAVLAVQPNVPEPGPIVEEPQAFVNATMEYSIVEADNATACMVQVLLPFLDALLNRTLEEIPIAGDLLADVRYETVPRVIEIADTIVPIDLQGTMQNFTERPVSTIVQTVLDLPAWASDPQNLQNAVTQTKAGIEMVIAGLLKPSSRHPQQLYDRANEYSLQSAWELIAEKNREASGTTGGRVDVIATADSPVFNLYTNRNGNEAITAVPIGNPTCIQLDSSTATRDVNGCDLYASLVVSASQAPTSVGTPTPSTRMTPTLTLTKAVPTATFNLEALGYLQLANSPYILVMGFNTNVDGANQGLPATWEATLHDYDAGESTNRSLSVTYAYTDTRLAIPLHLVTASFRVDENAANKPVDGNNETIVETISTSMANRLDLEIRRTDTSAAGKADATFSLATTSAMDLDLHYHDVVGDRDGLASLNADTLPAGHNKITTASTPTALAWTWSSTATTPRLDVGYQEKQGTAMLHAFQINATSLAPTASLASDAATHTHTFQTATAATTFDFLITRDAATCNELIGDRTAVFEHSSASACMTGHLPGYSQLVAQSSATTAQATGTRATSDATPTAISISDGNNLYFHTDDSASSWDAQLQLAGNTTQDLQWSSSAASPSVQLRADLNQGDRHDLLNADLATVPTSLRTTLNLLNGQGTLTASDYVGDATMAFSTTGMAPTAGSDHLRLRILPLDGAARNVESSWSLSDVKAASAQVLPNGTFEVKGDFQTPHPLGILFQDDTHNLQLTTTDLTGPFGFWLTENAQAGRFDYQQTTANPVNYVNLAGAMPGGRVTITLDGAPTRVHASAALANHTLTIDGSGFITSADLRYAPGGTAPTLPASNYVSIQDDATTGQRGFVVKATNFRHLSVVATAGQVTLDSIATSAPPFSIFVANAGQTTNLDVDNLPAHAVATPSPGSFAWSSTSPATTLAFADILEGVPAYTKVTATGAPSQLSASWTPRPTSTFDATVTHSAANLPYIAIDAYQGTPQPSGTHIERNGWSFQGSSMPAKTTLHMNPARGVSTFIAQTATGAPATAGHVSASFAAHAPRLLVLSPGTQGALLDQTGNSLAGTISLDNAATLNAVLFPDPANGTLASQITTQRTSPGTLLFKAIAEKSGQIAGASITNAAPDLRLAFLPGATGHDGASVTATGNTASGTTTFRLLRVNAADMAFTTPTTPATLVVKWSSANPLQVTASSAFSPSLQLAPELARAPWQTNGDFFAANATGENPSLGLRLSGIQTLTLDLVNGRLASTGDATTAPFLADVDDTAGTLRVQASDLASTLTATWTPMPRTLHLDTSSTQGTFIVLAQPAKQGSPRLLVSLDGVPAGVTDFAQDAAQQGFTFDSPTTTGRLRVAGDKGSGALQGLNEEGAFMDASDSSLRINLASLHHAMATVAPTGAILDTDTTSAARYRLNTQAQRVAATTTGGSGTVHLTWPNPTATTATLTASGVLGRNLVLDWTSGQDNLYASVTGSPASWSLAAGAAGTLDYTGGNAASLQASGKRAHTAFAATVTGVPSQIHVTPTPDYQSGTITTTGVAGRLRFANTVGNGGSGRIVCPTQPGGDWLAVDSTAQGGLLCMDLPNFLDASWSLPSPSQQTTNAALQVIINLASATSRPATLQFVLPYQQTRVDILPGLPAYQDCRFEKDTQQWTLECGSPGRTERFQHQESNGNSVKATFTGPGSLTVAPKANRAMDWIGGIAPLLEMETKWNAGYAKSILSGVPSQFAVDSNGLKSTTGSVSTLGSGTVGRANVFLVPDAGQTANRVSTPGDHAAVEQMGKAPYLSTNIANLNQFQWTMPSATSTEPITTTLQRSAAASGGTRVVLSGPREDVSANLQDPASTVGLSVYQSTNTGGATTAQPVRVAYTSTGGTTGRVDVTHVAGNTGQLLSSYIQGASGTTNLQASGAEPAQIQVTASQQQGAIGFKTVDLGTALQLNVQGLPSQLTATVTRGTCDATTPFKGTISTQNTGQTGAVQLFVGDGGSIPSLRPGQQAIDARCTGGKTHVGVQAPALDDATWDTAGCNGQAPYKFRVGPNPTTFSFATDKGFLQGTATPSGGASGNMVIQPTQNDGIHRSGPGVLASYSEEFNQVPLCMEFRDAPIDHLTIKGTLIPSDLILNIRKQNLQPGGELPTLFLKSISGATTGNLKLTAHLSGTNFDQIHEARIKVQSPFVRLDNYIGSGQIEQRRSPNSGSDGFSFVWNKDLHWHMQFSNLQSLDGYAIRGCRDMEYDVDYVRIPGTAASKMEDNLELNKGCEHNLLKLNSLPQAIHYILDWNNLFDNTFTITSSTDAIQRLELYANSQCFGTSYCLNAPGPLYWLLQAQGIPAGRLNARILVNLAASLIDIRPSSGSIGRFDFGLSWNSNPNYYLSFGLSNANIHVEWDLDGDTRIPGVPAFFFANTFGNFEIASIRLRLDRFGIGWGGLLVAYDYQLRFEPGAIFKLQLPLQRTGLMCGTPVAEVYLWSKWWPVPYNLIGGSGCV